MCSCIYADFQLLQELSTERLENRNFTVEQRIKIKVPCSTVLPLTLPRNSGRVRSAPPGQAVPSTGSLEQELNQQVVTGCCFPDIPDIPTALHSSTARMGDRASGTGHFTAQQCSGKQSGVQGNCSTPHTAIKVSSSENAARESRQFLSCHTTQNLLRDITLTSAELLSKKPLLQCLH